ncbi:MAG TPA: MotA/TolQ/ExbB proton channel family protein [Chitinophagales bacterium]|jgi:biopolymer transport protein ExbB|nr:MotA/TolQ/ExbB proton channel family protein [Chitinophagales bacterium]HPW86208.1 MotA/TolQ/ExbB proton channel family protein [Chitinophagales bacterium]HQO89588.1 MotA/TolQ/ExbB proton channel family protein [Chitinophagales bacterium]
MGILLQSTTVLDTAQAIAPAAQEVVKDLSILELLTKGGFMMIPLLLALVVAIFFIIERYLFFRQRSVINDNLVRDVLDKLYSGNLQAAEAHCIQDKSALGNVLQAGISQLGKPIDHIEKALEIQSNIELNEMEKRTSWISMISGVAPRLGFIGTILGVIKIFYNISQSADISIGTISAGLYEKMITSGTGLIVGVIAFMGFHFLLTKIDNYSMKLQKQIFEFVRGIQKPVK